MSRSQLSRFILIVIVLLLAGAVLPPHVALGQAAPPTPTAGYTYTIQRGDSWSRIARQTGVPIATLKANNPQAIHPQDWLYQGERLFIPDPTSPQPTPGGAADAGFWYQVKVGDAWGTVARANGVSVQALLAANPSQVQPNRWLFTGQWIWIPGADSPTAPARVTVTTTPVPTATSVATTTPEPTVAPSSTPSVEPTVASATPDEQDALNAVTEAAATVAAAAESAGLAASAAESAATAVAAANSIATSVAALSTQIALLNLATTPIVVTPTPAATAAATQQAEPTATQATATETRPALTATRAATSTRAAATAVATRTRVPTRTPTTAATSAVQTTGGCLLDKVIVANQAFDRWGQDGFQTAIQLYQDVLADTASQSCGETANELVLLRDYARFRLILSYVTSGQAKLAEPLRAQIKDPAVKGAADTFLEGLRTSGSIVQSCRNVIASVQAKPAGWRWLTELGLPAKPADVCPLG